MTDDGWIFPHCTFSDSFMKVYTMMLGEVGDVNRYQQKFIAQAMYLAFVFLVVILLSNVLIAMVTESHKFIQNERAEMVFWSNRLDFVAEMDTIVVIKRNIFQKLSFLGFSSENSPQYNRASSSELTTESNKSSRSPFRRMWTNTIGFLQDDAFITDAILSEFILYCILKVLVVIIVIPLWMVLGIASAGWFFPPQVREWLFVMKDNNDTVLKSNFDIDHEIDLLTKEVAQGRSEMKAELSTARQDCRTLRNEMKEIKSSVQEELSSVRDLTNALLQSYRRQSGPYSTDPT